MGSPTSKFRLRSFGSPAIEGPGGLVTGCPAQRQALALLTLVAVSERGQSRDRIEALLWPETDAGRAGHRLRQLLHGIRDSLGRDVFLAASGEIRLNPRRITSDVADFRDACSGGDSARAVSCYGGPLLDGFFLSGSPEFERWLESERASFRRAYAEALESLAIGAEGRGEIAEAAGWWTRLVQQEPLSSHVIIRLMSALAARGDRAGALEQARRYEEGLDRELEAEPNPSVVALADRLRRAPVGTELSIRPLRRRICIGVAPVSKLGAIPENFFAEGLTQELMNRLAQLPSVRVIPLGPAERLDRAKPTAVLEGILQQIDSRARLMVRLVDPADGSYLWSSRYDRAVEDVLAVQDELGKTIVDEISSYLAPLLKAEQEIGHP